MTRILSYNILVGGTRRIDQLTNIINSAHPDLVGLVEATNPQVVAELAHRLGMQHWMSGNPKHGRDWQIALLSRLPIIQAQSHLRPAILTKPFLEACVEEEDGRKLTVFVTHLIAAFYRGRGGDGIRRREVREILRIMASKRGTPHLLMGDFNAIAPGDRLKASILLRYLLDMDRRHQQNPDAHTGYPNLDFVVPEPVRFLNPLLRVIPRSKLLSALFDRAGSLYAPRGSTGLIHKAGYVDCFRHMNPHAWGFTCPARAPAGRIDFIFASPELAGRLSACEVVTEGNGLRGEEASDHLPVVADFGESVEAQFISPTLELDENAYLARNEEDEDLQGIGVG
jgi:endonuclease/exonuclease/phosphatase family metal-dependent hydrolase